jgi:hypothetical protein
MEAGKESIVIILCNKRQFIGHYQCLSEELIEKVNNVTI